MTSPKNSYFEKKETVCPCCSSKFFKENFFTGSGRFIAKDLKLDLRRDYKFSKNYGAIYPLIYFIVVCPDCFYADFPETFADFNIKEKKILFHHQFTFLDKIKEMFLLKSLDFNAPRNLKKGIISYFLAINYLNNEHHHEKINDVLFKKGLAAIRCAWCLDDLILQSNEKDRKYWENLRSDFYYLAYKCYDKLIDILLKETAPFNKIEFFGPDLDFNFGIDGILYLAGYLGYFHREYIDNKKIFQEKLMSYKRCFSRIFGRGKISIDKARPLILHAEIMYKKTSEITKFFEN